MGEQTGKSGRKSQIDIGKIMALKKAGWSIKSIADEMGMKEAAVSNAIWRERKKKGEQTNGL